jgi:hemerythrin
MMEEARLANVDERQIETLVDGSIFVQKTAKMFLTSVHEQDSQHDAWAILERLYELMFTQFELEESIMTEAGYFLYEHKNDHDEIKSNLAELIEGEQDSFVIIRKFAEIISDWLTHHVAEDDLLLWKHLQRLS